MALFAVNRHDEHEQTEFEPDLKTEEEKAKLEKILKRAQKRKRAKERLKAKQNEGKIDWAARKREERARKREAKANIVPVPEKTDDEFIDTHIKQEEGKAEDEKVDIAKRVDETMQGFTVLGGENFDKKGKVKRVLPKWLSNPTVISVNLQNLQTKVSGMKCLDKQLRAKLKANGIKKFFPVQAEVIPWLLGSNSEADVFIPRDVCVSAPTGSGKTLAFVLPVVQVLKKCTVKKIRALVLLPTQHLALQIYGTFKEYTEGTGLDVGLVTGKVPFAAEQKQIVGENSAFGSISKIDILICTAGRLVDHLKFTKGFDLQHLRFLIIDEADRVLDNVQNDWLYHLENHIYSNKADQVNLLNVYSLRKPRPPQKLLFSATLSQDPEKLQKLSLFQPKLFTSVVETDEDMEDQQNGDKVQFIGKYTTPKELTEKYIVGSVDLKPLVLYKFIKSEKLTKTMIFTNSAESAHRLAILLKSLFKGKREVDEISAKLDVKHRNALLQKFSDGSIDLLICTDALARGMDFAGVQCVISYSAPKHLKTYIHRAGRTARAGELGLAVTMLKKSRVSPFLKLLEQAGKTNLTEIKVPEDDLEHLEKKYKNALSQLKETVTEEKKKTMKKLKFAKRNVKIKQKRSDTAESSTNK